MCNMNVVTRAQLEGGIFHTKNMNKTLTLPAKFSKNNLEISHA